MDKRDTFALIRAQVRGLSDPAISHPPPHRDHYPSPPPQTRSISDRDAMIRRLTQDLEEAVTQAFAEKRAADLARSQLHKAMLAQQGSRATEEEVTRLLSRLSEAERALSQTRATEHETRRLHETIRTQEERIATLMKVGTDAARELDSLQSVVHHLRSTESSRFDPHEMQQLRSSVQAAVKAASDAELASQRAVQERDEACRAAEQAQVEAEALRASLTQATERLAQEGHRHEGAQRRLTERAEAAEAALEVCVKDRDLDRQRREAAEDALRIAGAQVHDDGLIESLHHTIESQAQRIAFLEEAEREATIAATRSSADGAQVQTEVQSLTTRIGALTQEYETVAHKADESRKLQRELEEIRLEKDSSDRLIRQLQSQLSLREQEVEAMKKNDTSDQLHNAQLMEMQAFQAELMEENRALRARIPWSVSQEEVFLSGADQERLLGCTADLRALSRVIQLHLRSAGSQSVDVDDGLGGDDDTGSVEVNALTRELDRLRSLITGEYAAQLSETCNPS